MENQNFGLLRQQNDDGSDPTSHQLLGDFLSFPQSEYNAGSRSIQETIKDVSKRGDGPWTSLDADLRGASTVHNPSFQGYRSQPLLSDCGTSVPGDSTYGSRPPPSTGDFSVFGEDMNRDAISSDGHNNLGELLGTFQFTEGLFDTQYPINHPLRPPPSVATAPAEGRRGHQCRDCSRVCRTRSELRKHELKHTLPFQCHMPGCSRSRGFTSQNDLDRHKRSVHSDKSLSGRWFVCHHGQCASKNPPKPWPRADNFRSHLSRVHSVKLDADGDIEQYVCRNLQNLSSRQDLQGVGGSALSYTSNADQRSQANLFADTSFFQTTQLYPRESEAFRFQPTPAPGHLHATPSTALDRGSSTLPPVHEGEENCVQPACLIDNSQTRASSEGSFEHAFLDGSEWQTTANDEEIETQDSDASAAPESPRSPPDSATPTLDPEQVNEIESDGPPSEVEVLDNSDSLESDMGMPDVDDDPDTPIKDTGVDMKLPQPDGSNEEDIMRYLKTLPKALLEGALRGDDVELKPDSMVKEDPGKRNQPSSYNCPSCSKPFNRQSDLRKHYKRHEKPYGCTFKDCNKAFGSKNDWKRHEGIQHLGIETWQCNEQRANSKDKCTKTFQRPETFKKHLSREHEIKGIEEARLKLDVCRKGRISQSSFWCGFCSINIKIGQKFDWWTERCNHIDDHISGRPPFEKRMISDWAHEEKLDGSIVCLEENMPALDSVERVKAPIPRLPAKASERAVAQKGGETPVYWECHNCAFPNMIKTSLCCIECQHQRCTECAVFYAAG